MDRSRCVLHLLLLLSLSACVSVGAKPSVEETREPAVAAVEIRPAHTFAITQGGSRRDRGINIIQTRDGGYAAIGVTSSDDAIQEDVLLVRLNASGEVSWSMRYGGAGDDNGWDLLEKEDGGFILLGSTDSTGAGGMDMYLISTGSHGEVQWERTFGGPSDEYGWSLAASEDGGYVLAGQTDSSGAGKEDGYLVKVNAHGEQIWSQTYGGEQEDRLFSVDATTQGGFIMTGTTRSESAGMRDLYLVRVDSSGTLLWEQVYGGDQDDVGHTVRRSADHGFVVTGYTRSFETANYDTWLLKTNPDGVVQWEQFFGGAGDDRAIYGEQTTDGGYILTGYTRSFGAGGWDVLLVKTDSAGEVIWHRTFGGAADDTGYTVKQTSDQRYILTGETASYGEGAGDMLILKLNQDGSSAE